MDKQPESIPNFFHNNFTPFSLSLASFITWMSANWAALSSVRYNPFSVLVLKDLRSLQTCFHRVLQVCFYFKPTSKACNCDFLYIACSQNYCCISVRLVLSGREKCSVHQIRDASWMFNKFDRLSLLLGDSRFVEKKLSEWTRKNDEFNSLAKIMRRSIRNFNIPPRAYPGHLTLHHARGGGNLNLALEGWGIWTGFISCSDVIRPSVFSVFAGYDGFPR